MLLESVRPNRGLTWGHWIAALALGLLVCISDIRLPEDAAPAAESDGALAERVSERDFFPAGEPAFEAAAHEFHPSPPEPLILPYDRFIHEAAGRYGLDADLIAAVIMAESRFQPKVVSKKGARGLMQIMPETAEALDLKDTFNPEQNIDAGTRHLKWLLGRFRSNLPLALAAYNAGEQSVLTYGGIPPFPETRAYVAKVIDYYQAIKSASIVF